MLCAEEEGFPRLHDLEGRRLIASRELAGGRVQIARVIGRGRLRFTRRAPPREEALGCPAR